MKPRGTVTYVIVKWLKIKNVHANNTFHSEHYHDEGKCIRNERKYARKNKQKSYRQLKTVYLNSKAEDYLSELFERNTIVS